MKKLFEIGAMLVLVIVFVTGCASWNEKIFDKDGKLIEERKFDGDLSTALIYDLKDKMVFRYVNGILARIVLTPPSKDMPTGGFEIEFIDANTGWVSIPKDMSLNKDTLEAVAKMIDSASSKQSKVTPDGIDTNKPVQGVAK